MNNKSGPLFSRLGPGHPPLPSVQIERGILERGIKSLIDYTTVFAMYRYLNTGVFMI